MADQMLGTRSEAAIAPAKLAHVVFVTPAIAPMRAWYQTVFGARVAHENPMLCFLTFDEEHHRIALAALPGVVPADGALRAGAHHCAFSYRAVGELLDTYARLKAKGILPYWSIHHGISLSMYYRDPDGNRIELQVDALSSPADAQAFMTERFPANPIGVVFDADALLARYRGGETAAALLRQPPMPADKAPGDMMRD